MCGLIIGFLLYVIRETAVIISENKSCFSIQFSELKNQFNSKSTLANKVNLKDQS